MSKPVARVTFFVLISLVLIAATTASVRGWLGGASENQAAGVQAHVVSGLQTNLNHDRSTPSELESQQTQEQVQPGKSHQGGGCQSEAQNNPNDF